MVIFFKVFKYSDMKQSIVDIDREHNEPNIYPDNSHTDSRKATSNPFELD